MLKLTHLIYFSYIRRFVRVSFELLCVVSYFMSLIQTHVKCIEQNNNNFDVILVILLATMSNMSKKNTKESYIVIRSWSYSNLNNSSKETIIQRNNTY